STCSSLPSDYTRRTSLAVDEARTTAAPPLNPSGRQLPGNLVPLKHEDPMRTLVLIAAAILPVGAGAEPALEPWASKAQPGDVSRRQVAKIGTAGPKYIVVCGGTMDGTNCRSPMGCGMNREGAIEQTWQSNRAVRMENVGRTDVVDPWLSNGRSNFRNI